MKTKQKQNFDESETAHVSGFQADRPSLMSECAEILATCAGLPDSRLVTVAEEMVDSISNLIDLGPELMFLAQCLNGIAEAWKTPAGMPTTRRGSLATAPGTSMTSHSDRTTP